MQYYSCITEKKAFYLLGHSLSALAQTYFTLRCPSCPVNFCSAAQGSPGGSVRTGRGCLQTAF